MRTVFIEASQGRNWGKFAVAKFDADEWARPSRLPGQEGGSLLQRCGWYGDEYVWVMDLQTAEGAYFRPGGCAEADLEKHAIWVCPMFEPFLVWLYRQDLQDLDKLPPYVELVDAPFDLSGYRRPGPARYGFEGWPTEAIEALRDDAAELLRRHRERQAAD